MKNQKQFEKKVLYTLTALAVILQVILFGYLGYTIISGDYGEVIAASVLLSAWCLLTYINVKEFLKSKTPTDAVEIAINEDKPSSSIYTQFNGLTKDEILWLYDHILDQKTALIEVHDQRKKELSDAVKLFEDVKELSNLQQDAKAELDAWNDFYVEHSKRLANVLPKIELLKDAVS